VIDVNTRLRTLAIFALAVATASNLFAQQARGGGGGGGSAPANAPKSGSSVAPSGLVVTDDYVIGPDDTLSVVFWRDKDMSADVEVRPDGKISLPVLNEIVAAGLTAEQLRARIAEAASKFVTDPTVSVVVRGINSRKVFITGMVAKPGDYSIPGRTTVLQLIAMAGGLHEFADAKNITINRLENGRQVNLRFNYKDVSKGKNLRQNIELKPGDTVIVP
jgi:polysaccharide biosynthesis/export protein